MTFGLTFQGFNPMRLEDIRAAIEADFRDRFGQNVRVDADSVNGQVIDIMSERFADAWEAEEDVFASGFIGSSSNSALDDLCALANITRRAATFSVVNLTLTGTPGTPIPAGSIAKDVDGIEWLTAIAVVIGLGGFVTVDASPVSTGPVIGLSMTINQIGTPIAGWNTVVNPLDAVLGRDRESDAALRVRFVLSFRSGGGSSVEAIRAVLLRVEGVTEALVIENDSDFTDSEFRPPHSFEAIVRGGADQDIAEAIWFAKPAGIRAYGHPFPVLSSAIVTDTAGDAHTIEWTRPIEIPFWFVFEYSVLDGAPADIEALVLAELLDFGSSLQVGQDVVPFVFKQHVETTGLQTAVLKVGTAPFPIAEPPVFPVGRRNLATFDSSRITFVRLN